MAAFQKACYQWLSKYAQLHYDVSLTDRDVRMLVGGEFDTESETPFALLAAMRASHCFSNRQDFAVSAESAQRQGVRVGVRL